MIEQVSARGRIALVLRRTAARAFQLGVASLPVLGAGKLQAQRVISPDSARPPLITDATPEARLQAVARLHLRRLEQALQGADTTEMKLWMAGASDPDSEVVAAQRRGCRSWRWAVAELRRTRPRIGAQPALPLDRLVLSMQRAERLPTGEVHVAARLIDAASRPRQYADFDVTLDSQGPVGKGTTGFSAAVCGMALAR